MGRGAPRHFILYGMKKKSDIISSIFFVIVLLLLQSCHSVKTILIEYDRLEYNSILDSVKNSGTVIGEWRTLEYVLDSDSLDHVGLAPIGRKNKTTGSIQIRKRGDCYNIKIIDTR